MLTFYINLKKAILYLTFWSLTLTLIALVLLFVASGRQAVEKVKKERGIVVKAKKVSDLWKGALMLYYTAWPVAITSLVLFFTFV